MKFFIVLSITFATLVSAQHQQQLDPSYLQQYYSQQSGARQEATPIYESGSQEVEQQYVQQGQQIRVKDNVGEQVRKFFKFCFFHFE